MPEQRYSIGESCAILDIDRVTLTRWLAAEGLQPQSDPRDRRFKYLTRQQLLDLARLHERTIHEGGVSGPRLTGVQRDMLARIQRLEEQVAQLERILTPPVRTTYVSQTRYHAPPERPERPELAANRDVADDTQLSASGRYIRQRGSQPRLRPGEWRTLPPIPPGWQSPLHVARALGVPARTFQHALAPRYEGDPERRGTLGYHQGRWRYAHAGNFATELLDPEQQEQARQLFRSREGE